MTIPADLRLDKIVQGLVDLRGEFRCAYRLEVLLVNGVNSQSPVLDRLVACVQLKDRTYFRLR